MPTCSRKITLSLLFILCLIGHEVKSQRKVQHDNFIWLTYTLHKSLKNNWKATLFLQSRRFAFPDRQHQFKPAIGVSKSWSSGISAGMSISYFLQAVPGNRQEVDVVRPEWRPFQFISLKQKIGSSTVSQRFMVEERWIHNTANGELVDGSTFSFRLRYRVMYLKPLDEAADWKLNINNEVMVNAGESVNAHVFDQNRLYLGLRRKISEQLEADVGYMYWYQQYPSLTNFASFHIVYIGITHHL